MRFKNLYARLVALAFLILSVSACQTAQHPVALMPPVTAPALKPKPATTPGHAPQQQDPVFAEDQKQDQKAGPKGDSAQKQDYPDNPIPPFKLVNDPVGDLIVKVEAEYQLGLTNYHGGKTEEAKKNFDNALNALLDSNFDIHSDDRLEKEFNRIVQG